MYQEELGNLETPVLSIRPAVDLCKNLYLLQM